MDLVNATAAISAIATLINALGPDTFCKYGVVCCTVYLAYSRE